MTVMYGNLKALRLQEITSYESYCEMGPICKFSPDEIEPLDVTAHDLTEEEMNEVSFGEPLKWSVLISDKIKAIEREEADNTKYIQLLCKLHNHESLSMTDYQLIDGLLVEYEKNRSRNLAAVLK